MASPHSSAREGRHRTMGTCAEDTGITPRVVGDIVRGSRDLHRGCGDIGICTEPRETPGLWGQARAPQGCAPGSRGCAHLGAGWRPLFQHSLGGCSHWDPRLALKKRRQSPLGTPECHNRASDVLGGPTSPHVLDSSPRFKPHHPAPLLPISAPHVRIDFSPLWTIPPGSAVPCSLLCCMYVLRMLSYWDSGQY